MIYKGEHLKEISFPLGGIGTGSVGLAGNGRLIDWEVFNRPAKGETHGDSHLGIKAKNKNGVVTKILNSDHEKDLSGQYGGGFGHGVNAVSLCGFGHFKNAVFKGEFPIAELAETVLKEPFDNIIYFSPALSYSDAYAQKNGLKGFFHV